jgi:N-acylneuraminate cytidylyltransferase
MKIAIIPARGGSKRIPRKNIKDFCGKPMLGWSIEAAREAKVFDRIYVSTDDQEIADIATHFGAECPFLRPPSLSDDFTGTSAVVKHALAWTLENVGEVDYVCTLYPTAPFVQPDDLAEALQRLQASDKQIAFSVTSFPFPIQRALRIDEAGNIAMFQPEHRMTRSQDLTPAFHDAGQFYWARKDALLNEVQAFGPAGLPIVLPRHRVQDIDTPEDWVRAEYMFLALRESQPATTTALNKIEQGLASQSLPRQSR